LLIEATRPQPMPITETRTSSLKDLCFMVSSLMQ
jgi:hypothetical protein